jgi:hypothetical protein
VGILHGSTPPFRSILCLVPIAACNCFSTAPIFCSSSMIYLEDLAPLLAFAAGYVWQSFSCSTMSSTSCNRSSILSVRSSSSFTWAASLAGAGVGLARVDLDVVASI